MLAAQVVSVDAETDLAVLKIDKKNLFHLELADSDEVEKGELVFAFGSPLGLENSVTRGIVSSTARQLSRESPMIYIQTDAAVNPGNSGGPLFNLNGRLVGINSSIVSPVPLPVFTGLGFAVSVEEINRFLDQVRGL